MSGVVLTCEHASNALPPGFDPGVGPEVLASHLGYDPGALEVARALADHAGLRLLAGEWSRLYVDLNRSPDAPAAVPAESCGVVIRGNVGLSADARARRLARVQAPYRAAVLAAVEREVERAGRCLHVSVHSFTPALDGRPRPYDAGVLFDPDRLPEAAAAEVLLEGLRAAGRSARPNEPYAGTEDGVTTWLRTRLPPGRYAGIEVELNQALLAAPGVAPALGQTLAGLLGPALAALA